MPRAESPTYAFTVVCCGYVFVAIAIVIAFITLFQPNGKELALIVFFCGAAVCQLIAIDMMGSYDLDFLTSLLAKLPIFNPLMYIAAWGYTDSWLGWLLMIIWTGFIVAGLSVMFF